MMLTDDGDDDDADDDIEMCKGASHPFVPIPIILKNHNGKFTIRHDEKVIIST